jgi:hypothetical protein
MLPEEPWLELPVESEIVPEEPKDASNVVIAISPEEAPVPDVISMEPPVVDPVPAEIDILPPDPVALEPADTETEPPVEEETELPAEISTEPPPLENCPAEIWTLPLLPLSASLDPMSIDPELPPEGLPL